MGSSQNQRSGTASKREGKDQTESILQEAERIINGERRADYGPAEESFNEIAGLWSVVIGTEITAEQVALCMVMLKISRYLQGSQRDSAVDMAGYIGLLEVLGCLK